MSAHSQEDWFGIGAAPEKFPMTLHILLATAEPNSMVWVTDLHATLGLDNTADIEKISYSEERKLAYSAWGDHSFGIRDEFGRWQQENLNLSSPDAILESLNAFVRHMHQQVPALNRSRGEVGFVLVTFLENGPRIYFAVFAPRPVIAPIEKNLWAGDDYSQAKIFIDYYYTLSKQTIEDALLFGIHAMRLAHRVKFSYVGEPNAWVFRDRVFKRLGQSELAEYIRTSQSLDAAIYALGSHD